jgi:hypothetical protein
VLFTLVLGVLIVIGSRKLAHFDAALVGYTFATLFAVFGLTYRYSMWLQRPPTALYWRRGWQVFFRRKHRASPTRAPGCGAWSASSALNRLSCWGPRAWLAHFLLMWGRLMAAAITFLLVFGWLHFESVPDHLKPTASSFGFSDRRDRRGHLAGVRLPWPGVVGHPRDRRRDAGDASTHARRGRAAALQKFHEDFLPLILLFAVSLTGLLTVSWHRG